MESKKEEVASFIIPFIHSFLVLESVLWSELLFRPFRFRSKDECVKFLNSDPDIFV